ncbi:cannabinoid receptor type 1A [Elysia marginata]|uniref:Cannabinoid receptor type 1A n=1 Tax=Elysia marginata TaxID=1093978 RepID=A0AAV4IRC5_9GAST|nr:cannabinoid receptor type 1A [Elysia marginata]
MESSHAIFSYNITNITISTEGPRDKPTLDNIEWGTALSSFAFVLNAVALAFIIRARSLRKPLKILIKSHIICSLFLSFSFIIYLTYKLHEKRNSMLCYPVMISIVTGFTNTYFSISLFAVLNFVCVLRPIAFRSSLTAKKVLVLVLGAWVISLLMSIAVLGVKIANGYCVPLFYMKQYGCLFFGLTWSLSAITVVVFNFLTVKLLRKSTQTAPFLGEEKESVSKTSAPKSGDSCQNGSSRPLQAKEKLSLPFSSVFQDEDCQKEIHYKLSYSTKHPRAQTHFGRANSPSLRHGHIWFRDFVRTKELKYKLERQFSDIFSPSGANLSINACIYRKSIESFDLYNQKKMKPNASGTKFDKPTQVPHQNKHTHDDINLATRIENTTQNNIPVSCNGTLKHSLVLCPMEFLRQQNFDPVSSLTSDLLATPQTVCKKKDSLFTLASSYALQPRVMRRHSEPTLRNISTPITARKQTDRVQCVFPIKPQATGHRPVTSALQTLPRPYQANNSWRSPHNKKKLKIILTLMILSMWSVVSELPITCYMIWRSTQPAPLTESASDVPGESHGVILIGFLGNTFLYAWRFLDLKEIARRLLIRCRSTCP